MNVPSGRDDYQVPSIRNLGTLRIMTATVDGSLHFSQAALGSLPPPGTPTPTPPPPTQPTPTPTPDQGTGGFTSGSGSGEVASAIGTPTPTPTVTPTPVPGTPPGGGTTPGGGGGGGLPFTGLAVGPLATLGAALAGAGTALRRFARKL